MLLSSPPLPNSSFILPGIAVSAHEDTDGWEVRDVGNKERNAGWCNLLSPGVLGYSLSCVRIWDCDWALDEERGDGFTPVICALLGLGFRSGNFNTYK